MKILYNKNLTVDSHHNKDFWKPNLSSWWSW